MFRRRNPVSELKANNRLQRLRKIAARGCSHEFLQEVTTSILDLLSNHEYTVPAFEAVLTLVKLNAREIDLLAIINSLSEVNLNVEQEVALCRALVAGVNDDNSSAVLDYTTEVAMRHVSERALVQFITEQVQKCGLDSESLATLELSEIVNLVAQHCLKTPSINEYSVAAMHLFRAVVQHSWSPQLNCREVLEVFCIMYNRHKVWQLMRDVLSLPLGYYYFLVLLDILYSSKNSLHPGATNLISRSLWSRDSVPGLEDSTPVVLQAFEKIILEDDELVLKEVLTGVWHMLATGSRSLTSEWHSIWKILEKAHDHKHLFMSLLRGVWQQVKLRKASYQGSLAEFERALHRSKLS